MDITDMRTTLTEDRKGIALLRRALQDAYEAGCEPEIEEDVPDAVDLWNDLLAVLGAST